MTKISTAQSDLLKKPKGKKCSWCDKEGKRTYHMLHCPNGPYGPNYF